MKKKSTTRLCFFFIESPTPLHEHISMTAALSGPVPKSVRWSRCGSTVFESRWYIGAAAIFSAVACNGSFFGFPSLGVALTTDGVFAAGCGPAGVSAACASQAVSLNNVFTVGSSMAFLGPLAVGALMDRWGPRLALRVTSGVFAAGVAAAVAAAALRVDALWFVFAVLCGFSSSAGLVPLYSYSNLFPGHGGLALALLCGGFDASALVYLIMQQLRAAGVAVVTIFVAYLCGPVLVLLLHAALLWPNQPFAAPPAALARHAAVGAAAETGAAELMPTTPRRSPRALLA